MKNLLYLYNEGHHAFEGKGFSIQPDGTVIDDGDLTDHNLYAGTPDEFGTDFIENHGMMKQDDDDEQKPVRENPYDHIQTKEDGSRYLKYEGEDGRRYKRRIGDVVVPKDFRNKTRDEQEEDIKEDLSTDDWYNDNILDDFIDDDDWDGYDKHILLKRMAQATDTISVNFRKELKSLMIITKLHNEDIKRIGDTSQNIKTLASNFSSKTKEFKKLGVELDKLENIVSKDITAAARLFVQFKTKKGYEHYDALARESATSLNDAMAEYVKISFGTKLDDEQHDKIFKRFMDKNKLYKNKGLLAFLSSKTSMAIADKEEKGVNDVMLKMYIGLKNRMLLEIGGNNNIKFVKLVNKYYKDEIELKEIKEKLNEGYKSKKEYDVLISKVSNNKKNYAEEFNKFREHIQPRKSTAPKISKTYTGEVKPEVTEPKLSKSEKAKIKVEAAAAAAAAAPVAETDDKKANRMANTALAQLDTDAPIGEKGKKLEQFFTGKGEAVLHRFTKDFTPIINIDSSTKISKTDTIMRNGENVRVIDAATLDLYSKDNIYEIKNYGESSSKDNIYLQLSKIEGTAEYIPIYLANGNLYNIQLKYTDSNGEDKNDYIYPANRNGYKIRIIYRLSDGVYEYTPEIGKDYKLKPLSGKGSVLPDGQQLYKYTQVGTKVKTGKDHNGRISFIVPKGKLNRIG